jgi:hypothetical protein
MRETKVPDQVEAKPYTESDMVVLVAKNLNKKTRWRPIKRPVVAKRKKAKNRWRPLPGLNQDGEDVIGLPVAKDKVGNRRRKITGINIGLNAQNMESIMVCMVANGKARKKLRHSYLG